MKVIATIKSDAAKVWKSTEVYEEYLQHGGTRLQRRTLVQKVSQHLQEDFILLSSRGYASRLISKTQASAVLGIKETRETSELDGMGNEEAITKVANKICNLRL